MWFSGHIRRWEEIEKVVAVSMREGTCARGRLRLTYITNLHEAKIDFPKNILFIRVAGVKRQVETSD